MAAGWTAHGEHELPADDRWLAPDEARRAAGMRFTKRRGEYLLRRWTGKRAVAAATGLPTDPPGGLARIEVRNRRTGAPHVLVDGSPAGLDVSLTDRAGWAVCLVAPDLGQVGCDLEIVEPRSDGFVSDFLTDGERAYVLGDPPGGRDAAANLLWSAKESALKVLRTGLRRDTRSVEVTVDTGDRRRVAGWSPLEVRLREGGVLPGWWRREGDFVLTVATDRPGPPPEELPGSTGLAGARPVHSWVGRPLAR